MNHSRSALFAPFIGLIAFAIACAGLASLDWGLMTASAEPVSAGKGAIDGFINARLQEEKLEPSALCSDDEFCRRVHLDLCGSIPTRADVKAFLGDRSSDKRAKYIETCLKSERYADHWTTLWSDLLREHTNSKRQEGTERGSYHNWIHESLAKNQPYDKFMMDLMCSIGSADDDGAANFYLRDEGNKVETVNTIATAFMGTRLACAQCHDHPFDKWTQQDFHGVVAFLGRTDVVPDPTATLLRIENAKGLPAEARKILEPHFKEAHEQEVKNKAKVKEELASGDAMMGMGMMGAMKGMGKARDLQMEVDKELTKEQAQRVKQIFQQSQVRQVIERPVGEYKMADDGSANKKSKGAGEVVQPTFIWDLSKKVPSMGSRRKALAEFMIASPRFAEVQVNRLWSQLMGRGIVDPVDDFRAKNPPTHPELLTYLAQEFVKAKFDNKEILRQIMNSNVYQRSSMPTASNRNDTTLYSHQRLRRMTAEQTFDSILVASGRDKGMAGTPVAEIAGRLGKMAGGKGDPVEWAVDLPTPARVGTFMNTFNQPSREQTTTKRDDSGSIPQALEMLNGNTLNGPVRSSPLVRSIMDQKMNANQAVVEMYLAVLSRNPSNQEMTFCANAMSKAGPSEAKEVLEDLLWALLNAREFAFIK
jgi:hypothetical protein